MTPCHSISGEDTLSLDSTAGFVLGARLWNCLAGKQSQSKLPRTSCRNRRFNHEFSTRVRPSLSANGTACALSHVRMHQCQYRRELLCPASGCNLPNTSVRGISLSIIEVGLQESNYRDSLLRRWSSGTLNVGGIGKELARDIWKKYGTGLWDESWEEYFGNLAQAVHPYAHYSSELMGWQIGIVHFDGGKRFITRTDSTNPDPVKASGGFAHSVALSFGHWDAFSWRIKATTRSTC